jgi:hypothetical protein
MDTQLVSGLSLKELKGRDKLTCAWRTLFLKRGNMKRIFVLLLVVWLTASCSGKGDETAGEESAAKTSKPVQMIPDEEFSEFEKLAKAYIKPYFDANGTQSEKTVKPGDIFELYIVSEFSEQYTMSAAEFKLVVPEGISVLASTNCDSTILNLGKYDVDFMIAFHCKSGPGMWLVKYQCKVDDGFKGGVIETQKGINMNFLGFTMCDVQKTMIKARPGKAVISVK